MKHKPDGEAEWKTTSIHSENNNKNKLKKGRIFKWKKVKMKREQWDEYRENQ